MDFQAFTSEFFQKQETRGWGDDYKVYDLNVSELRVLAVNLSTPTCQTELCEERVAALTEAFRLRPHFFQHKTTFVVAVVVSLQLVFIVDGQHRLKFLMQCDEVPPLTTLRLVAYNVRSEQEMRELFQDLNHDSFKNHAYVSLGIDQQRVRDEVKLALHEKYHQWFPKTKKKNTRLRTLAAFVDDLPEEMFSAFATSEELVQDLISSNHRFLQKLGAVDLYNEERDVVQKGQIVFPLIFCNFVEFATLKTTEVYYEGPRQRKAISQKTRRLVWVREFGETATTAPCPVCNKSTLSSDKPHGFECGHVVSHKNKGEENVENLRPICAHCNQLMGTMNWDVYVKEKTAKKTKTKTKAWFGLF
jgi:hypothetical protein